MGFDHSQDILCLLIHPECDLGLSAELAVPAFTDQLSPQPAVAGGGGCVRIKAECTGEGLLSHESS